MSWFSKRAEQRRLKRQRSKSGASPFGSSDGPLIPVMVELVPMTISDMAKGFNYEPGMTILKVWTFPVFGSNANTSFGVACPVKLPPECRELNVSNAYLALSLIKDRDPVAAAKIAGIEALAQLPNSRAFAKQHPAFNTLA